MFSVNNYFIYQISVLFFSQFVSITCVGSHILRMKMNASKIIKTKTSKANKHVDISYKINFDGAVFKEPCTLGIVNIIQMSKETCSHC